MLNNKHIIIIGNENLKHCVKIVEIKEHFEVLVEPNTVVENTNLSTIIDSCVCLLFLNLRTVDAIQFFEGLRERGGNRLIIIIY